MELQYSIADAAAAPASTTPTSRSTARFAIFTCEFDGAVAKIDLVNRKVLGTLHLSRIRRPEREA